MKSGVPFTSITDDDPRACTAVHPDGHRCKLMIGHIERGRRWHYNREAPGDGSWNDGDTRFFRSRPCGWCRACQCGRRYLCRFTDHTPSPDEVAWDSITSALRTESDFWRAQQSGFQLDQIPDRPIWAWLPPLAEEDWYWIDSFKDDELDGPP